MSISYSNGAAAVLITLLSLFTSALSMGAEALIFVSRWHIFKKLGMPGWKGIIPYYGDYILFKTLWETTPFWVLVISSAVYATVAIGTNFVATVLGVVAGTAAKDERTSAIILALSGVIFGILTLAYMVIAFIVQIRLNIRLARVFGKGTGFALGLTFISVVFYPILAFGKAHTKLK